MTVAQSLFKNTLARTATEFFNRFGAAIFWVFVARHLGASALGALAYGLSLHSFFLTVSTLGIGAVVIRDVARERAKAAVYFGHSITVGSLLAILTAGLMAGVVLVMGAGRETRLVCLILAAAILPGALTYWSKAILSAAEQMAPAAFARLCENLFKVLAGILLLVAGADVLVMALVIVVSKVIAAIITFVYARRIARPVWSIDTKLLKYLRRQTPSFALIALANSLFWAAPVIILARFAGEAQAGIFSAAYKLVDIAVSFALAYGQAMFPIAARTLDNVRQFRHLVTQSIKFSLMLTLGMAVAVVMLAEQIVLFLYGADMAAAIPVLRLSIWMVAPFAMVPVLAYALVSHNQQRFDLLANSLAALVVIGMGLLLTPVYGALGTAWSVVIGCLVFWLAEWLGVRRQIFRFPVLPSLWKPVFAALVMAGLLYLMPVTNLFFSMMLAGVTYGLVLLLSKAISKKELLLIKQLKSA